MLEQLYNLRVHFLRIRDDARAINQPLLAYLAEMGIAECEEQMDRLRKMQRP